MDVTAWNTMCAQAWEHYFAMMNQMFQQQQEMYFAEPATEPLDPSGTFTNEEVQHALGLEFVLDYL